MALCKPGRTRRRKQQSVCVACLLFFSSLAQAAVTLEITGVEGDLADNIRLTVGQPRRLTERSINRYIDDIPEQAGQALSALGYYSANIKARRVAEGEESDKARKQRNKNEKAAQRQQRERKAADDKRLRDRERRNQRNANAAASATAAQTNGNTGSRPATTAGTPVEGGEKATAEADAKPPEPAVIVAVDVTLNAPVRIQNVSLAVNGPASNTSDFTPTVAESPLRRGEIFVSGDYESTKSALLDQAQDLGYFEFEFTTASVRVSRRSLSADINLQADSGPRYTFGLLKLEQDIFSESFIRRWVPFEEGEPFQSSEVAELTENLQKSGYFSSVRVLPQQDRRYGKSVPVIVRLKRRENNLVGVGIGYSTDDDGIRGKLTWDKPLINRFGHSFESEFGISAIRQNASLAYRIPRRNKPLTNYFSIEYGLQRQDNDDGTDSLLSTLNFQRVRLLSSDWTESVFIRWEHERWEVSNVENETDLVMPGVSYTRARSKGEPFTRWGQSEAFQVMYGNKDVLSSIDFLKTTLLLKFLRSLSERNTLILGLQYGAIESNNFNLVPLSQRFYAGGDSTIRGFKFRDVAPRDADDEPIGGRYLEVASLEYNYHFLDAWAAAVFVDAGRAFNNLDQAYSAGAGFGIRWQSPVGPFKIDIATPISDGDGHDVRVHLSLGPEI